MSIGSNGLDWGTDVFSDCYYAIQLENDLDPSFVNTIKHDLFEILVIPLKNDSSRTSLLDESKTHKFLNADEVKLNKPFIEIVSMVASDFNFDELMAADLIYQSKAKSFQLGCDLRQSAHINFMERYQFIVNILGYIISNKKLDLVVSNNQYDDFFKNVLSSFNKIYQLLTICNDNIDKQKITDNINNLTFIDSISFIKSQLFIIHELLSQMTFSLFDNYYHQYQDSKYFNQLLQHINASITEEDSLISHYLPLVFKLSTQSLLDDSDNDKTVDDLYNQITKKLTTDYALVSQENDSIDISKSTLKGYELVVYLLFFTKFIGWCKQLPSRTSKYDFKHDILKYIEWLINYGVMEKLLSYTAESSDLKTKELLDWRNFYDFRSLLQRNCPRLVPVKFQYPAIQELIYTANSRPGFENVTKLGETSFFVTSKTFVEQLIVPFFHEFFTNFITNAAIVLTLLRDTEEDFLLSSVNKKQLEYIENEEIKKLATDEDSLVKLSKLSNASNDTLDLDEIATRSELERFYLAFTYTYSNRPELCTSFWSDENMNDIIGLISWGLSNNSSPLITATFCLLLGSLASAGNDSAIKIWDLLVDNNNSTLKRNDFSIISIDSIIDSLNYYADSLYEYYEDNLNEQLKRKQKRQEFLFSNHSGKQDEDLTKKQIIIELSEDSVVFISGFVQLISSIVRNLSSSTERSKQIKNIIFDRFNLLIKRFLKFDNIVKGSKTPSQNKTRDTPSVNVSNENSIILVNLFLGLMGDFVIDDDDLDLRYNIWRIIDRWVYHALQDENENNNQVDSLSNFRQPQAKPKFSSKQNISINQGFDINLTDFTEVSNFVTLMNIMLRPLKNSNEAFAKYNLLYPADLGLGYRYNNQIGIWPYIEYLISNVFANAIKLNNPEDTYNLQILIMDLIENSFREIDWDFLGNIATNCVKELTSIDDIFDSRIPGIELNYQLFVKLHHSVAIFNYLFDEKVYSALFSILDMGVEKISGNKRLEHLLETSLYVFDSILKLQGTFINSLLPILRNNDLETTNNTKGHIGLGTNMSLALKTPTTIFDNLYLPRGLGTNGISSFYELLLFKLSTVVNIALYVGSFNSNIADSSIKIVRNISNSDAFTANVEHTRGSLLLKKNRLLSTFESIDESVKLQYAFMDQFESHSEDLNIKYQILQFLIDDLNRANGRIATTAHFILGYEKRGGNISLDVTNENNTLLKSLLRVLDASLDLLSEIDFSNGNAHIIDVGPAKLSSLILEIIVRLSRDTISSNTTLSYLVEYDSLFEKLMRLQPKIDADTLWNANKFNGDLQENIDNAFIQNDDSTQTFVAFINYRNLVLQYLSLEFHHIISKSKKEYYSSLLLNNNEFLDGSPRVLGFLDILNYSFKNFEGQKVDVYEQRYNLPLILEQIHTSVDGGIDLSVLTKLYKVMCQNSNLITKDSKIAFADDIIVEANHFRDFVKKLYVSFNLRSIQLKCLHSWCQLIEVLITDNDVKSKQFILEVLQVILPKINDYLEADILFSEELISLSVLLFDAYEQEFLQDNNGEFVIGIQRLFPLLKTCITGVLNSNSTPNLRSDLYVLANKFLSKVFAHETLVQETTKIIRSIDKKFIEVIGNDAIYSEGSSRITSILLLESLIHLTSITKVDFVLELLIQNNSLLLLVMSLKRTDEMLQISSKGKSGVSMDTLLYELTAFKSTLYFLVRVAQSKAGALKLIQNELFSILKESKILKIDPDIGLNLKIQENPDFNEVKINLVLDTPVSLIDLSHNNIKEDSTISYLEFLIPIFQLVSTILLSMGPSYKPSLVQAKELMNEFTTLVVGIMKRDLLMETKDIKAGTYVNSEVASSGLKELVKLFTLLDSLIHYKEKQ